MNQQLKQRLVGAMVVVALAIIFLPSLLQKDDRVPLDTTSEIPPAPIIEPVVIKPPERPVDMPETDDQALFQPKLVEQGEIEEDSKTKPENSVKFEQPGLNESGVPIGWVVQVGSFKSKTSAEQLTQDLIANDFKAYSKPVSTKKGEFVRIFIGPFIDQKLALATKQQIDRDYQVDSKVLRFNPASGD